VCLGGKRQRVLTCRVSGELVNRGLSLSSLSPPTLITVGTSPLPSPISHGSRVRTPLPLRRQVCPDTKPCAPDETHPPTCRLYFTTFPHPPPKQETLNAPGFQTEPVNVRGIRTPPSESSEPIKHYYFTIDDQLMYMSFFQDWGPLNVAMVYKACIYIHSLLIVSHSPSYDVWPRTLVWRSDVV
jgi:hypothetical protein